MSVYRLCEATLPRLPSDVRRPLHPRPAPAIVHLGIGSFHRAHMAEYTEDAEALAPGGWGIIGVAMRSPAMRDALKPQDGLYTVVVRDGSSMTLRVLGAVRDVLSASEEPAAVVARLAAPQTRIVSLTVTENGYALTPATRRLRRDDPRIAADLVPGAAPRTPIGLLHAAMAARRAADLPGFTVLCCDNLPANGATLEAAVRDFAEVKGEGLADWMRTQVRFPNAMVDRIAPATTAADRSAVAAALGVADAAPVVTEAFRQWVVEDRFIAGRPAWERVGVEFVDDVAPYELMKLRLLNGSHSAIAYLGALTGIAFVHEVVGDPVFRAFIRGLMEESCTTVPLETAAYRDALVARFDNRALQHRCRQIAMDGTQKLPQRLIAPAAERLAKHQPIAHLAMAIASWMRYVAGSAGDPIDDPLAAELASRQAGRAPADRFQALLDIEAVFGAELPRRPAFVAPVRSAYLRLWESDPRTVAARAGLG